MLATRFETRPTPFLHVEVELSDQLLQCFRPALCHSTRGSVGLLRP